MNERDWARSRPQNIQHARARPRPREFTVLDAFILLAAASALAAFTVAVTVAVAGGIA